MSNPISVSLWCSRTYHAALTACLAPFDGVVACRVETFDAQEDVGALQSRIAAAADRPVIVFYSDLGDILYQSLGHLHAGTSGENRPRVLAALEDWIAGNAALCALFYKHRKTVTLLPALALIRTPGAVQALLRDRFAPGMPPFVAVPPEASADDSAGGQHLLPDDLDPKFALMAGAILQTATAAQAALGQLEAVSTPLEGFDPLNAYGGPVLDRLIAETGRQAQAEGLQAQHDLDLRRLMHSHEQAMQGLMHRLDAARQQYLQATAVQSDLSDALAQKTAMVEAIEADHRAETARLETARDAAISQLEQRSTEIARLTRRLSDTDARHIAQTDEIERLTQENAQIFARAATLSDEIAHLSRKLAEGSARHLAQTDEIDRLRQDNAQITARAAALSDEVGQMLRKLTEADARHIAQTDEIDRLRQTNGDFAARTAAQADEIDRLRTEGADLRDQMQAQVGAFDLARERQQTIRVGLENKLAQNTKSIMALSADVANRDTRITQVLADLQAARNEVDALRSSTSWRITEPLRRVVRRFNRLRGR